jgi:hypothetical protein
MLYMGLLVSTLNLSSTTSGIIPNIISFPSVAQACAWKDPPSSLFTPIFICICFINSFRTKTLTKQVDNTLKFWDITLIAQMLSSRDAYEWIDLLSALYTFRNIRYGKIRKGIKIRIVMSKVFASINFLLLFSPMNLANLFMKRIQLSRFGANP